MPVSLQKASDSDLPAIATLAHAIWHQHYIPIIGQAQVDYMLGLMYSAESLNEQVHQKHQQFFLVRDGAQNIGFVSVSSETPGELFLHKFYIDQQLAGRGTGSEVFRQLIALFNPSLVRLTVNRQNYKSINFYFKNGFVIERVADFDIGQGYVMNDFVMTWKKL